MVCFFAWTRAHPPPRTAPPEAYGTANRWSGVVRGTKVAGKSRARALRRRFPAPHRFDLKVPEGGKWGGAGLLRFLLDYGLKPFLGGVLGECDSKAPLAQSMSLFSKNRHDVTFWILPP